MSFAHGSYLRTLPQVKSCILRHMHAFRFRFFGPPIAVHQVFQPISYKKEHVPFTRDSFSPSLHDSETCDLVLHSHDNPSQKTCASVVWQT